MIETRLICTLLLVLAGHLFAPVAQAVDNNFHARIVLFIQQDADPPERYLERLESLAVRTESFFANGLNRWKRPVEREQCFARNKDGKVDVTLVRGKVEAAGRGALPEIQKQAITGASKAEKLNANQPVVWWILYDYLDVKGFRGGARGLGGMAINAYPKGNGLIGTDVELATPEMAEMAIKGTIHELGHALGLPHIGPRPGLKLGNSLMGPVNRAYWGQTGTRDARVHLSEVAAAMLWKHPVFRRNAVSGRRMPRQIDLQELAVTETEDGRSLKIAGTLSANMPAHTAVLLDSRRANFGDYWKRPYAGAIDKETGAFEIIVTEPFDRGTLYLSFCFENGTVTADGQKPFQQSSAIEITYDGEQGSRTFGLPAD